MTQRQYEHQPAADRGARRPSAAAPARPDSPLFRLQRQLGNRGLARLLSEGPEIGAEGGPVSRELASEINARRGRGAPLSAGMRQAMEQRFATSFEEVRVHTGAPAQELARQVSARAFTTGSDIFLGEGASPADQRLLAHELTHVVQQRSMPAGGPLTVTPAGDAYEREAERMARS